MINEGWEKRIITMRGKFPDGVFVGVDAVGVYPALTEEEIERIKPKLRQVEEIATHLAWNMVKGTIKYPSDDWSVNQWQEFLEDDLLDVMNYLVLMKAARERESQ